MRRFSALAITFLTLLALFLGLSMLSASIPREALTDNVRSSILSLYDEGNYLKINTPVTNFYLDNYSDAIMINQSYGIERTNVLSDAVASKMYYDPGMLPFEYLYNEYIREIH
ncbi:MAG: hypothetical protein Q4C34_06220 [Bacteroidales bacterium]|nr:hypothetical protein [Bacteroidales bacterium]